MMMPTRKIRLHRIRSCIADLADNGIQLRGANDHQLVQVVRDHLEYFQMMLGYDSDAAEVLDLIRRRMSKAGSDR